MQNILSSKQMKEADSYTISKGTSSIELMERAGHKVFDEIIKRYDYKEGKYLVVVGKGGNGGDGYVVARLLYENGYDVTVLDVNEIHSNDCLTNKNLYKGKIINEIDASTRYDVVIDALFGVGLNSEVKGIYLELIQYINSLKDFKIVSIDISSGLNADNGKGLTIFVKSNLTIAIQEYKLGHFLNDGQESYDELVKVDIGIKAKDYSDFVKNIELNDLKILFPKRKKVSNKGNYGRVLLIGGSKELNGAILLSASSLCPLLLGAGYSTIGIPSSLQPLYALRNLENTYLLFKDKNGHIVFDEEDMKRTLNNDVIAIGMGIGVSNEVYKIISYLLKNYKGNLLIDADGLNSISKYGVEVLKDHQCNVVLTPHLKEFSRLIDKDIDDFSAYILKIAESFARKYKINLVLKSNVTIITNGDETYLNTNGNPSLAKGGSGDILSGMIAGMLTKKQDTLLECAAGSYFLGRTSDLAVKEINENSVLASDLLKYISKVIDDIQNC